MVIHFRHEGFHIFTRIQDLLLSTATSHADNDVYYDVKCIQYLVARLVTWFSKIVTFMNLRNVFQPLHQFWIDQVSPCELYSSLY